MITRYYIIVYAHENQRYTKQINDKPVVNFNKQLLAKNVAVQKLVGFVLFPLKLYLILASMPFVAFALSDLTSLH